MKLKSSLDLIVPHLYGDHTLCANACVTWCSFLKNPSQFRYRSLPEGKPLTCPHLKNALTDVIENLKGRAASLTSLGSTQANENFNFIVSTKAPKNKSFGSSKSLRGRISASVLQKNEGQGYLAKVNKAVGLSPGEFTMKVARKIAAKRKLQKAKAMCFQAKRKRLVKKIKKSSKEATKEMHEGTTYSQFVETTQEHESNQTTEIPQRLTLPTENSFQYITFDIETTGRGRNCDILQIAAGDFNVYVQPRCRITDQASSVNGILYNWDTKTMIHRGNQVSAKPIQEALLDFLEYMKKIQNPVLVGHNACSFDIPILTNRLREFNLLGVFSKHVVGFVDTLKISKRVFAKSEVGNYKQENLVNKVINCTYHAHDAKEDVRVLTVLFTEKLEKEVKDNDLYHIGFHEVKSKYTELLQQKCISVAAVSKLARSGVTPFHLRLAHTRNHGLKLLLNSHKVHLTTKYLSSLVGFLEKEE
ncbi:uncharacterized protein LOC134254452 [Saccostrea cucullata]|uniref:uncharacterized protein LOC134254452 n=1 Tax=Saccostrea cuccullata TaxID=36930 RepID=UPI002ED284F7